MWIFVALAFFAFAVALHALVCRTAILSNNVARYVLVGGIVGLALIACLQRVAMPVPDIMAAVLLYAFASELYIFLFTMITSSVSVSILRTLQSRALSDCDVDELYSSERMVQVRLERLLSTGLVHNNEDGFGLTPRGQQLLAVFERLRGFFRHPVPSA